MLSFKIGAVLAFATFLTTSHCSVIAPGVIAPAVVAPPIIKYTQVAPPNIHPFAAQVSTFTRGLNVLAAPYAAGVFPAPPAIIQRALLPAPVAPVPAPIAPVAAPIAPVLPHLFPAPQARSVHAVAPALVPALPAAPLWG